MKLNSSIIRYLVVATLGMGLGWQLKPSGGKTTSQTTVSTREERRDLEDVKETIREVIRPDGTKEVVTDRTARRVIETDRQKDKEKSKVKVEATRLPQYSVAAYMSLTEKNTYTLTVDRRILGNIFLGAYVRSDLLTEHDFGLGVRLEF